MKILMTSDGFLSGKDAQTTHVMEVFRNLSKFSTVHLIALNVKNSLYKFIYLFFPYYILIVVFNIHRLLFNIPLFIKLSYHILKTKEPTVIYSRYSFLTFSPLLSKLFRVPYVVEVNGILTEKPKIELKSPISELFVFIIKICEKTTYKYAKRIVVVTPRIKDEIKRLYNIPDERIIVIPNGANTDLFKPINQERVREELRLEKVNNYICFAGSLSALQGVEYIVKSAPLVLEKVQNAKFLIVGDGPIREELMELADKIGVSDNFIFTGTAPYEEVPKYINASDICVVYKKPLKSGYSPLKLYEYMACEKPVIASRVEGFEILEENHAGLLVEPENPKELAKAIIKLLKDGKLREEMGKNGREYVVKNHSWEAVARKVAEVCKSVVVEHENKRR